MTFSFVESNRPGKDELVFIPQLGDVVCSVSREANGIVSEVEEAPCRFEYVRMIGWLDALHVAYYIHKRPWHWNEFVEGNDKCNRTVDQS